MRETLNKHPYFVFYRSISRGLFCVLSMCFFPQTVMPKCKSSQFFYVSPLLTKFISHIESIVKIIFNTSLSMNNMSDWLQADYVTHIYMLTHSIVCGFFEL